MSSGAIDDAGYARRFAAEHAHYDEDLPFWRGLAARLGSPVLDLGAASGRVAIRLARDGHEVIAVDRSPHMLRELRRRLEDEPEDVRERVRPLEGDLAGLPRLGLEPRFPLILMAMNTFQVLTEPEDRLACLTAVRDLLAPGGELGFDVALPDFAEILDTLGVVREGGRHVDRERGVTVRHSAWYEALDPATHTAEFVLRIQDRAVGGAVRTYLRRHRVHLFLPSELSGLLADAGLRVLAAYGDFEGGPVGPDSERQVYRCAAA
jgi:SAM-dependent methyltransferase